MTERDDGRAAVLLTGVGKRYDIVSAFGEHAFTIAADPNPLAPARYAADLHVTPPRIDDPGLHPVSRASWPPSTASARSIPLTDLDIEALAGAGDRLPSFVPSAEIARATFDKYETHELLLSHGLPSPPTVLPGEEPPSFPVMVKPRRGLRCALDPPGRRPCGDEFFVRLRPGAGDDPEAHGRARVLDRHPLRPRRALPQRDPAHDDRVARRASRSRAPSSTTRS